ncbi:hypothetical protein Esti_002140 [Eimeria stiedai]
MADTATAAAPNAAGEPAAAAPPAAAPTPAAAATPASAAAAAASSTSSGAAASLASKPLADNNKASEGVVAGFDQEWAELQKLQDLHEHAEFGSLLQPGEPPAADSAAAAAAAAATDTDKRSVYVGNVDYSATPADLQEHFKGCGQINRITIMVDRFTGHPKGYAYIEFNSELAAQHAVLLSESTLKDRQIKFQKGKIYLECREAEGEPPGEEAEDLCLFVGGREALEGFALSTEVVGG